MKKVRWNVQSCSGHDARIAKRLHKMMLRMYKYAAKHGLWDIEAIIVNSGTTDMDLYPDTECYVAIKAYRYDTLVVSDSTYLPIIEEPEVW